MARTILSEIAVGLGDRSYTISVGSGLMDEIGAYAKALRFLSPVAVITDSQVGPLYAARVADSLRHAGFEVGVLSFPAGEPSKNLSTIASLYDGLVALRPERKSGIVALGGGVVGDMAGFVAATYLRGIPFIQVPTTLLAQVDASVGGKVGIDHPGGKNLIGAFHQPRAVLIDTETLRTLDPRQVRAGLAEIIKHGIIADADLFERVLKDLPALLAADETIYGEIVPWNCRIKARVVEQDEKESGLRAILNFGHTIGHAVESLTGYERYLHGEAVALGMLLETQLGVQLGFTPLAAAERFGDLLRRAGYPLDRPSFGAAELIQSMFHDKKVEGGKLRFVFPTGIGSVTIESVDDLDAVRRVWDGYSVS